MPVRDGGEWLRPAVQSILDQSLTALELIVVDDHSRDGALHGLGSADPRLTVLVNAGRGIVAALNTAVAAARAPLLARMDADDIALSGRLALQREFLHRHADVGIVAGEVEIFTGEGWPAEGYRQYQQWVNALRTPAAIAREIFIESPLPHPTVMMHREVFEALGGYREVPWSEDYDLWLRAFERGVRMAKPAGVVLRWRDSAGRLSRVDERCSAAAFVRAKAHFLARTLLASRAAVIWGAGNVGAQVNDALRDEGLHVEAFVDVDPRKIGGRKRGLPVWAPDALPRLRGDALVLGAVGSRGARPLIRARLEGFGWREGEAFVFLA